MNWKCFWIGHRWLYSDFRNIEYRNFYYGTKSDGKEPFKRVCKHCGRTEKKVLRKGLDYWYEVEE